MIKRVGIIIVLSLIILLPISYVFRCLFAPIHLDFNINNHILVIDKDVSARSLTAELKKHKIIKNDKIVLLYIKLFGISKSLKAGIYAIHPDESIVHVLKRIVAFDVLKRNFQITPGVTNSQLASKFTNAEFLNFTSSAWVKSLPAEQDLLKICIENFAADGEETLYSPACVESLKHGQNYEGLYLADTYQYDAGSNAANILSEAHLNLQKCLFNAWHGRSQTLPYKTPYDLLIAASILEKESAIKAEKYLIAGVIVNRLQKNMPLQMDPTVIYGLGDKYIGQLSHADMQVDTKYNTYKNKGLPPSPIANCSCESIIAASQPTFSDYLYFVARKDGTHFFSKNYSKHLRAIKRFRQ